MSRKRVILVCMVDSIHVARWISQFDSRDIEFILFPSTPNRVVHPGIQKMMCEQGNIKIVPFGGFLSIPLWVLDLLFSDFIRGLLLRRVIKVSKPDFVHALELQHGGYITSRALEDKSIETPFIATNYGSDIYWFQQFPKDLKKIKKLLSRANRYSAECNRDVELAKSYGFIGGIMPVFPNAGGFSNDQLNRKLIPTSERKVVAIKGYEGWVGRASVAVEALYSLVEELADYKIIFYSCNFKTIRLVKRLKRKTKLNIEWHAKGHLSHEQMLEIFASARIYVGLSLSDGISTSLLEAMAMGAMPIQTASACVSDWVASPGSPIVINNLDRIEVSTAISKALSMSPELLTKYFNSNRAMIADKASQKHIAAKALTFYK